MVRQIVFDLGNVVLRWDPRFLFKRYFSDHEEMDYFLQHICNNEWNLAQDKGRSFAEGVQLLQAEHPDYADAIAAYDQHWHETLPHEIAETSALLHELHEAQVPLYAITNFNDEKFREAYPRFPVLGLFRDIVVSGDEKILKPEPEIYHILLKRNQLQAEDCLFIDDNLANVAGAEALGFHGHHFTSPALLCSFLKESLIYPRD